MNFFKTVTLFFVLIISINVQGQDLDFGLNNLFGQFYGQADYVNGDKLDDQVQSSMDYYLFEITEQMYINLYIYNDEAKIWEFDSNSILKFIGVDNTVTGKPAMKFGLIQDGEETLVLIRRNTVWDSDNSDRLEVEVHSQDHVHWTCFKKS